MSYEAESEAGQAGLTSHDDWHPHFGLVLVLISVTFLFVSAAPTATWSILVAVALQGATFAAAVNTTRVGAPLKGAGAVIAFLVLVAAIVTVVSPERSGAGTDSRGIVFLLVAILVALVAPIIIVGVLHDLRDRGVTTQAVLGAISVYLVLGIMFAGAYGAIANLGDGSLFTDGTDGDLQSRLYFSFATLTTLGYGDFSPATDLSRTLAVVEALLGQLYLVTVIAVLVGNLGRSTLRRTQHD